ncbi:alpha/beta hydrolase fold protein [Paenibacillus curdlanolyticus YK9]|uniref:Alpha/beta hydrolase fold protein n=1 Tax=Paenibacillus curdlanolyticus YK9 TaxID=717606 RepID=E0I9U0_9BACL|nr:alpha/beta hydrolase [Paenibacillus curdlanolyticus]EFM10517.1 alpha/beta hydrolase fold protein [Paenibacillus curdlanolyticus YK9]
MNMVSIADKSIVLRNGSVTLAYKDTMPQGNADTVVVLLHGFCGSSAYWETLLPLLERPGRRIIAPDHRGHGRSSAPSDAIYTMEQFAEDAAALVEELGLGPIILLGHSLGGYATLAFAERHPDKLRSFGIIHSTAFPDSEAARDNRDRAVAAIREQGIGPFVEGLVPKLFASREDGSNEVLIQEAIAIGRGTTAAGAIAASLGMKERPDRTAILESSTKPVLLVAGQQDGVIPPERTFTTSRAGVKQVLLEQAGHMGMIETPEELAAALNDFIEGK